MTITERSKATRLERMKASQRCRYDGLAGKWKGNSVVTALSRLREEVDVVHWFLIGRLSDPSPSIHVSRVDSPFLFHLSSLRQFQENYSWKVSIHSGIYDKLILDSLNNLD